MIKLLQLSILTATLVLSQNLIANNKKGGIVPETIEKIEKKYNELSANASVVKANGQAVAKGLRFIHESDGVVNEYSKLRQIALVRHGEPDLKKTGKFSCEEAGNYIKCYDNVCIIVPDAPFFDISKDRKELKVFSSPIARALSTAHYLCGTDQDIETNPIFREFETSIPKVSSKKKLPIKWWTAAARVKWMTGIGKDPKVESFSQARGRAKEAAQLLSKAATAENPKVLLTAHGMQNRYIKKYLKSMGWKVVEDTGNDYFGTTILVKIEE